MVFGNKIPQIKYYIMQSVKGHWQVLLEGKVNASQESFKRNNRTYHVDLSRVREDSGGHKYLQFDYGYFEPLTDKGLKSEPQLEARGSIEATKAFSREGWIANVMRALGGTGGMNTMVIAMILLALVGGAGIGGLYGVSAGQHQTMTIQHTETGFITNTTTLTMPTTSFLLFTTTQSFTTTSITSSTMSFTTTQLITSTTTNTYNYYVYLTQTTTVGNATITTTVTRPQNITTTITTTTTQNVTVTHT